MKTVMVTNENVKINHEKYMLLKANKMLRNEKLYNSANALAFGILKFHSQTLKSETSRY